MQSNADHVQFCQGKLLKLLASLITIIASEDVEEAKLAYKQQLEDLVRCEQKLENIETSKAKQFSGRRESEIARRNSAHS
jgi:hypothetical protein